jgi:cellulose synthase operon protein C
MYLARRPISALKPWLAGVAWIVLLAACTSESPQALLASGKALEASGERAAAVIRYKSALQADPTLLEARIALGRLLLQQSDFQGAEIELARAAAEKAPPEQVAPLLARAIAQQGEYKKLVHAFSATRLGDPKAQAEVQTQLAVAWNGLNDKIKSEAALAQALAAWPEHPMARLMAARFLAANGKLDEAAAAADKLVAGDPRFQEALQLRGELHAFKGDAEAAASSFTKALEVNRSFVPAHLALIGLSLDKRDLAGARKRANELQAAVPVHPATMLVDAQIAAVEGDLAKARERVQKLLSVLPDHEQSLLLAASIEARLGAVVQAAAYYRKVLTSNPQQEIARIGLAQNELRLGQGAAALDTLKPLLAASAPAPRVLAFAAEAQMRVGNMEQADLLLQRAARADPADTRLQTTRHVRRLATGDGSAALSDLQQLAGRSDETVADEALFVARLRRGEYAAALAAVDQMARKQPGQGLHDELRGRVHLAQRDLPAARKAFEGALKADPALFGAVASLVALDLEQRQVDQAVARLQAVIKADPQHSVAMLALAEVRQRQGAKLEEVRKLMQDAAAASPNAAEPRLKLIDLALRKRQFKDAVAYAQEAQAAIPGDAAILDAAALAQLQAGQLEQSLTTLRKLVAAQPNSATPYLRLAEVYRMQGKLDAAETATRSALDVEPDSAAAQNVLLDLLLATKRNRNAAEYVRRIREAKPNQPWGYSLEAAYHLRSNDDVAVLAVLREGVARTGSSDLAGKLYSHLVKTARLPEADRFADGWLKQRPGDAAFEYLVSVRDIARGDLRAAETRLKRVVAAYPANAVALNNLAYVQVKNGNAAAAVESARRAVDILPDRPALMDTLALALAADKQLPAALDVQRRALEIAPDNALLRLGLARLALETGDKTLARAEVAKLEALGASFQQQGEVAKLKERL